MSTPRLRPLSVGPLRTFEVVSRTLNFRKAAEELALTQPAVSRQIQGLERELGARLLERDTRGVRLTAAGAMMLRALGPWLGRVDGIVRQVRQAEGREAVALSTFASMASLWLMPRMHRRPFADGVDLRIASADAIVPNDDDGAGRVDAILRYCRPEQAPENATPLFEEIVAPVAGPGLLARRGAPGLRSVRDLAHHVLIEDLDLLPSTEYRSWFAWLQAQGHPELQPRSWIYLNLAHQQVQAALEGHGVALGRLPLVIDALASGALVEPFRGRKSMRIASPYAYWLIAPAASTGVAARRVREWIQEEARATREAMARYLR